MTTTDAPTAAPRAAVPLPATRAARWGAWLLAVSPVYFVVLVVANVGVLASNDIGLFEDITRAEMDRLGAGWILPNVLYPLALILGAVGLLLLGIALARRGAARAWAWAWTSVSAAIVSIVLCLPYAPFRIAAMGFTEDRLGDNWAYSFWDPMGYVAQNLAIAATALLCIALFVGTRHRRAALVIGGLTVVYLIGSAAQLPLPPFVISFLWCALGIAWLRGIRRGHAEL